MLWAADLLLSYIVYLFAQPRWQRIQTVRAALSAVEQAALTWPTSLRTDCPAVSLKSSRCYTDSVSETLREKVQFSHPGLSSFDHLICCPLMLWIKVFTVIYFSFSRSPSTVYYYCHTMWAVSLCLSWNKAASSRFTCTSLTHPVVS